MSNIGPADAPVTFRLAMLADESDLVRLAALDSSRVPDGDLLLGEVGGELWAAVSSRGEAIADPFRPSGPIVGLLRARAAQLGSGGRPPGRRRRLSRGAGRGWRRRLTRYSYGA